jgi:signal transduction histidine kinase
LPRAVPGVNLPIDPSVRGTRDRARAREKPPSTMTTDRIQEFVDIVRRVRHDANNPITAALGHVQLLLEDPNVRDAEVRESLTIIEGELRRLIDILRRLGEINVEAS